MRRLIKVLSLVAVVAAGCSKGSSSSPPNTGGGTCTSVVADAGNNQIVGKNAVVSLSAIASFAKDAAPLHFAWQLASRPAGSQASLTASVGPTTSFRADVAGTYVVKALVTGSCTSQASVQIVAANEPPTAHATAQPSGTVPVRSPVVLDGTTSSDPDGDPITYGWSLTAPIGSAATLNSTTAATPSFTPDLPGHYQARLVVSDGSATSLPFDVGVDAADLPPVGRLAKSTLAAQVGETLDLDASSSSDPDGDTFQFSWALLGAPAGSTATIASATSAVAHLTFDVEGVYTVQVTVTDSVASGHATATVTAYRPVHLLGFSPIDAEYSTTLDRIVMVSSTPAALHVYDAAGAADTSVTLPLAPTCVGVSPDGKFAAVGHSAYVSLVDLQAGTVLKTLPISADAADVILTDPMTVTTHVARFAYVYPLHDQWSNIHVVDLTTGAETLASNSVYAGGRFKRQPASNHVFLVELGLSPQQLYRYDIQTSTGAFNYGGESPYWGDYGMGSNFWISGDGSQILFSSGNRFRTSDMTYAGTANMAIRSAFAPASPSAAAGTWIVQPATSAYPPDTTSDLGFRILDAQFLTVNESVDYPKYTRAGVGYPVHGQYVFFDAAGTRRIAVVQVDASASLMNDFGVVVY
jgi:hypothetical protein